MSDALARAVAASDAIKVGEEEFRLSPVTMRQLQEIQREALHFYKREFLQTYADNIDLLGNGKGQELLEKKLEEAAKWDMGDLPQRTAYSTQGIKVTKKLRKQLEDFYGDLSGESDETVLNLLATALDSEQISVNQVVQLTGMRPEMGKIAYDGWWITATYDGMVTFIHQSLKKHHSRIKKDTIAAWPLDKLAEAARLVEKLTTPAVGNM